MKSHYSDYNDYNCQVLVLIFSSAQPPSIHSSSQSQSLHNVISPRCFFLSELLRLLEMLFC